MNNLQKTKQEALPGSKEELMLVCIGKGGKGRQVRKNIRKSKRLNNL